MNADEFCIDDHVLVKGTIVDIDNDRICVAVSCLEEGTAYVYVSDDNIKLVTLDDFPYEPPNGSFISGRDPVTGNVRTFLRNDVRGPADVPRRRFDRHWWDVMTQRWITYPDVIKAGGDPQELFIRQELDQKTCQDDDR